MNATITTVEFLKFSLEMIMKSSTVYVTLTLEIENCRIKELPMKIYLIRHGETDWNVQNKIQGSNDIVLNPNGIAQAKKLGDTVKQMGYPIRKVYTSPQKRAHVTAQYLSEAIHVDLEIKPGLEEMNLGAWEGITWKAVKEHYPKEFQIWYANRTAQRPPNGESYPDVLQRSLHVVHTILEKEENDFAIVSHGAVIKCLLCYAYGLPFDQMDQFHTGNTSITIVDSEAFLKKDYNWIKDNVTQLSY